MHVVSESSIHAGTQKYSYKGFCNESERCWTAAAQKHGLPC
jgi:hypothetical protein